MKYLVILAVAVFTLIGLIVRTELVLLMRYLLHGENPKYERKSEYRTSFIIWGCLNVIFAVVILIRD